MARCSGFKSKFENDVMPHLRQIVGIDNPRMLPLKASHDAFTAVQNLSAMDKLIPEICLLS